MGLAADRLVVAVPLDRAPVMVGTSPCCGAPLLIALPPGPLPRFARDVCDSCGARLWHRFSRVNPETWTEEQFLVAFEVDDGAKTIKSRCSA